MRYEVNPDTFAVSIFEDGQDVPFQYQPHYPNGDSFDSVEEASTWAEASIAAHSPSAEFYAPDGKGWEPKAKPNFQERQDLINSLGLTPEQVNLIMLK